MLPPLSDLPRLPGLSLWKSTSPLPSGQPSGAVRCHWQPLPVLSRLHSCNLLPDVGPHPLQLPLPYLLRLLVTWLVPHPRAPGSDHAPTPKAPGDPVWWAGPHLERGGGLGESQQAALGRTVREHAELSSEAQSFI